MRLRDSRHKPHSQYTILIKRVLLKHFSKYTRYIFKKTKNNKTQPKKHDKEIIKKTPTKTTNLILCNDGLAKSHRYNGGFRGGHSEDVSTFDEATVKLDKMVMDEVEDDPSEKEL